MMTATASAQSALDAYQISQNDLKGTARFMSMAGAFGALGGDLSTLNQNPAGIGVYRTSEIGLTLDLNMQGTKTTPYGPGFSQNTSQTKFYCNNFGYVGSVNLSSDVMPFFNWGASFTRAISFDRVYSGGFSQLNGSLTNYVANYTTYTTADRFSPSELSQYVNNSYNPYQDSQAPWMSILFYNNYLINMAGDGYAGLFQNGTTGYGSYDVRERGYVDEYAINFGGNIMNTVYWGIGFGITDLSYTSDVYYSETLNDARVPSADDNSRLVTGDAGYGLSSWKHIYGTGFNFKAGVIVKPINELRLGLAVHTPTYYNLTQEGYASVNYDMSTGYRPTADTQFATQTDYGWNDYFQWESRTPWRLIASAAGVVGGRFIISGDYEYRPYQQMNIADNQGIDYNYMNQDVKTYYQSSNIVRVGAEYRLTPQVSVRAGYSYESTPVTQRTADNFEPIYTSGPDDTETTPSYSLDKSTQYFTCGLGYRYKGFYVDGAFVHKTRNSTFHGFTPLSSNGDATGAPMAEIKDNNNSIVVSIGYKF